MGGGEGSETFEVFDEKRGIGEVELLGNLGGGFVGVAQRDLDAKDDSAVDPLLGCEAAGLPDYCAQIALGEAQFRSVKADLVLPGSVAVDKIEKAVEDSLLMGAGGTEAL